MPMTGQAFRYTQVWWTQGRLSIWTYVVALCNEIENNLHETRITKMEQT